MNNVASQSASSVLEDYFSSWYIPILTVCLGLSVFLLMQRFQENKDMKKNLPPKLELGMWNTNKCLSGTDLPWFLLRTAYQELKSNVFRVNLPFLGAPMVVVVGDAATNRAILSHPKTTKTALLYAAFETITIYPSGFSTDGPVWHAKRKACAPAFGASHTQRMKHITQQRTEQWIADWKLKMKQPPADVASFDVAQEVLAITMDSIGQMAFQYTFSPQERAFYLRNVQLVTQEFVFDAALNPFRPLVGLLLPSRRRAFQAVQDMDALAQSILDAYRERQKATEPEKDDRDSTAKKKELSIIDCIMKNDKAYANDGERKAEIQSYLIAGYDSVALTIAWTLLELARGPVGWQQEIREAWNNSDKSSTLLQRVIKESMRLHTVLGGGVIRTLGQTIDSKIRVGSDQTATTSIQLPKGTIAFCSVLLQHHDPAIFDQPHVFQPFRWEQPTREMKDAFLPYAMGKQNCIGQSFANVIVQTVVGRIIAEFDLQLQDEGHAEYFLSTRPVGARLCVKQE